MPGRIVLLGPPGAGKGTQAIRIAGRFAIPHVSTGDIFRAHIEENTPLGRQIEGYLVNGQLVPDTLACEILVERLSDPDCRNGYVLDGFPRTLAQARQLDELLDKRGEQLNVVLALLVPDDEIVDRLTARRSCPQCGKIFNLKFDPPPQGNNCDRSDCEGQLEQREDDHEDTIRERLRVYHADTEPIVDFYNARGLTRAVDAAGQNPDEVAREIEDILATPAGYSR